MVKQFGLIQVEVNVSCEVDYQESHAEKRSTYCFTLRWAREEMQRAQSRALTLAWEKRIYDVQSHCHRDCGI